MDTYRVTGTVTVRDRVVFSVRNVVLTG